MPLAIGAGAPRCGGTENGHHRRADRSGNVHGAGIGGNNQGRLPVEGGQGFQGGIAGQTHGRLAHAGHDIVDNRPVAPAAGENHRQPLAGEPVGDLREFAVVPQFGRPGGHRIDRRHPAGIGNAFGEQQGVDLLEMVRAEGHIKDHFLGFDADGRQQHEFPLHGMDVHVHRRDFFI